MSPPFGARVQCPDVNHRTSCSAEAIKRSFEENLYYAVGKPPLTAGLHDYYMALAYTVRDRLLERYTQSMDTYLMKDVRLVSYLSAEFLEGPHLANNLINLGIDESARQAMAELGLDFEEILALEPEPGLGNGGLGRLAACFLDSMATLRIPAVGYGIRYEHGIFEQRIQDGWQVEFTDNWLHYGNPWELRRPQVGYKVGFGGHTEGSLDEAGRYRVRWVPALLVRGVAHDTPIPGFNVNNCTLLRLWKAEATKSFDFQDFNVGDYYGAVEDKIQAENITKVLYPNDEQQRGRRLRLEQQYFFTSCSLQDLIAIHCLTGEARLQNFHLHNAIQLNDTHPSLAIPELMRLLVDEHGLDWDPAWEVTRSSFNYTNHTLLPEALERWSLPLFASVLPRHLEIIYEINHRFLDEVRIKKPFDENLVARMSIIDESGPKYLRMANLACIGSSRINGVAALHTELLKKYLLRDFHEFWPKKIVNVTNGVTPRRWLAVSNPGLAALITEAIGEAWIKDAGELERIEALVEDSGFREQWRRVRRACKIAAAARILGKEAQADPDSLFDVLVKRIHEYKRQHLDVLHVVTLYMRLKNDPALETAPRTFVFGGKAAPGYHMAKLIIKLITSVARVINSDPTVNQRLRVLFLPNFNVKKAHFVYPMADLSEQISMAGKEASGTGNMKFAMNGALTIGTLDGANIEIRDQVGADNFFAFGLNVDEAMARKAQGHDPMAALDADPELRTVIALMESGHFSGGDRELFKPLVNSLKYRDEYLLFADYRSYVQAQERVDLAFRDREAWTRASIRNTARSGHFSSDRSIADYNRLIWNAPPIDVRPRG